MKNYFRQRMSALSSLRDREWEPRREIDAVSGDPTAFPAGDDGALGRAGSSTFGKFTAGAFGFLTATGPKARCSTRYEKKNFAPMYVIAPTL
jgi:hypothetical protein